MLKAKMRAPKGAIPLGTTAAILIMCARYVTPQFAPEYTHPFEGLATLIIGGVMIYLTVTLPIDFIKQANEGTPEFDRVPQPGAAARPLIAFLGICMCVLGIAMLVNIA